MTAMGWAWSRRSWVAQDVVAQDVVAQDVVAQDVVAQDCLASGRTTFAPDVSEKNPRDGSAPNPRLANGRSIPPPPVKVAPRANRPLILATQRGRNDSIVPDDASGRP